MSVNHIYDELKGKRHRKPEVAIEKEAPDCNPQGASRRGHPRNTWERIVQEETLKVENT